jgi:dynein heavy chain 2
MFFLQTVHKSLSGLTKVIRGTALVDDKVSRLADNLMNLTTPATWQKMWEGPEDPIEYITTIVAR